MLNQNLLLHAYLIDFMIQKESSFNAKHIEEATLGGGCFWCTEAVFSALKGVEKVEPGYAGGNVEHPTYEQVSTCRTGHAEVAQSPTIQL